MIEWRARQRSSPQSGDREFESLYPSRRLSAGRHCRLAGPGRPAGSRPRIPAFLAPGTDLRPGRSTATEVPWEVAPRAPVQGLTLVTAARRCVMREEGLSM